MLLQFTIIYKGQYWQVRTVVACGYNILFLKILFISGFIKIMVMHCSVSYGLNIQIKSLLFFILLKFSLDCLTYSKNPFGKKKDFTNPSDGAPGVPDVDGGSAMPSNGS